MTTDEQRDHFKRLEQRYTNDQNAFLSLLEHKYNVPIQDDPANDVWELFCAMLESHTQFEVYWHNPT